MSQNIRKALVSSFGDASHVSVVTAPISPPSKDEYQIRVFYSGFGGADVNIRAGIYPFQRKAPLTLGYCLVGRVVALGPGSTKFAVGDTVTAVTTYDAQAELVNVKQSLLIRVLPELSNNDDNYQQLVGLALDWNTAYGMVVKADVKKSQKVFIHGLSGAVGQALLFLCKLRGASVYGTASLRNHPALLKEGVTAFEYRNKDWMTSMKELGGADVVFDPLGFESWEESWDILNQSSSRLVGYGGNLYALGVDGTEPRSPIPFILKLLARGAMPFCAKKTTFYYIKPGTSESEANMVALMELFRDGKIRVPIKAVWDLETEAIREAHSSWGKIEGMGSLLVRVTPPGASDDA